MKYITPIINIILALALMLFIISASVAVTLNFKPLYYADIDFLSIPEMSGYSEEEIRENYDVLISYNNLWGAKTLEFPTLDMSETGRIHFEEVKAVFVFFEYLAIVSCLAVLAGAIYRRYVKSHWYLLLGGILTVAIPAVAGILIALNWQRVFVLFHEIVFDNDYWVFDPATDPVITILPNEFFMHCAIMIVALAIAGAIVCIACYKSAMKREAERKIKELEGVH